MNEEDITKLIDELCCRNARNFMLDAGVQTHREWVEGFLEHSCQVLHDYYSNHELPI
jgi:hypothetical protein